MAEQSELFSYREVWAYIDEGANDISLWWEQTQWTSHTTLTSNSNRRDSRLSRAASRMIK